MISTLHRVAQTVRRACDRIAPELGYEPSLLGFCPFASTALVGALAETEIADRARLMGGLFDLQVAHFWVEVRLGSTWRDDVIVDLTATQFDPDFEPAAVIQPGDKRGGFYAMITHEGAAAEASILYEDADMMQVLPARWWTRVGDDAATLDARVLTILREDDATAKAGAAAIARAARATEREVWEALGRLARRPAITGRAKRAA